MVIKEKLLKNLGKLPPEERLKKLKELEEQIKIEEKITEETIIKEKEVIQEKQETDARLEKEQEKARKKQQEELEKEEIHEKHKGRKQQEELQELDELIAKEKISAEFANVQVEYHARLLTETDHALEKWQDMNSEQLSKYQSQAKNMYEKLNEAYKTAVDWIKDDIVAAKERMKQTLGINEEWWQKAPGEEYTR